MKMRTKQKQANFRADSRLSPTLRNNLSDFVGSGFDRGHLAPAGDHKTTQENLTETFLLSNTSPQVNTLLELGGHSAVTWHMELVGTPMRLPCAGTSPSPRPHPSICCLPVVCYLSLTLVPNLG